MLDSAFFSAALRKWLYLLAIGDYFLRGVSFSGHDQVVGLVDLLRASSFDRFGLPFNRQLRLKHRPAGRRVIDVHRRVVAR